MVHTFEYIPEELELEVFTSIIQFFDFNEHYDNINYELVQLLKSKINCSNNIFLMDLFGQKLLETKTIIKIELSQGYSICLWLKPYLIGLMKIRLNALRF